MEALLTRFTPKSTQPSPLNKEFLSPRQASGYVSPILNLSRFKAGLKPQKERLLDDSMKIPKTRSLFYKEIVEICKRLDPKFELDEEGTNCYSLIKETLNKAVNFVIVQAGKLAKQAKELEQDKEYIQRIQENLAEIEKKVLEREKELKAKEDTVNEQSNYIKGNNIDSEEIGMVLLDLQAQIEDFNKDIAQKEKSLQNWANQLEKKEKFLEGKQNELKTTEWNLKKSELELNLLAKESGPTLKIPSNKNEILYRELFVKNQELEKRVKINNEEFRILQAIKNQVEGVVEKNVEERKADVSKRSLELEERKKEIGKFAVLGVKDKLKKINAAEELRQERVLYEKELEVRSKEMGILSGVQRCLDQLQELIKLILKKESELKG